MTGYKEMKGNTFTYSLRRLYEVPRSEPSQDLNLKNAILTRNVMNKKIFVTFDVIFNMLNSNNSINIHDKAETEN